MSADVLTVLVAEPGKRATKLHRLTGDGWETEGYDSGWLFDVIETLPIDTLETLHDTLAALSRDERACVVRGRLVSDFARVTAADRRRSDGLVRRLLYERYDERGEVWDATFTDCDRTWLCIDIDEAPAAHPNAPKDWVRCVRWIVDQYLPPWLAEASGVYQWSASSGVRPWDTLSIHLWFLLDRDVCSASLRQWFNDCAADFPHLDRRLYNPVQVHYTADPVFESGDDPIPCRLGVFVGERERALPPSEIVGLAAWDRARSAEEAALQRRRRELARDAGKRGGRAATARARYAAAVLANACARILESPKGSRHDAIIREGRTVGGHMEHLDRADAVARLIDAASAVYEKASRVRDVPRIVEDAVSIGEQDPIDVSHIGASRTARENAGQRRERQPATSVDHARAAFEARKNGTEPAAEAVTAITWKPGSFLTRTAWCPTCSSLEQLGPGDEVGRCIDPDCEGRMERIRETNGEVEIACACGWRDTANALAFDGSEWRCPECGEHPHTTNDERLIITGFHDYGGNPDRWPPAMREAFRTRET